MKWTAVLLAVALLALLLACGVDPSPEAARRACATDQTCVTATK